MADIQFSSVTTGVTTGAGYFDVLMKSISAHIEIEYQQNRLNGTDYATVYLGAMQYAISTAEKFVLAELLTEAQIELINAQKLAEDRNAALRAQQIISMQVDDVIKQAQSTADLALKTAQTDNYTKQALNTVATTLTEGSKKLLVERQTKGFDDDAKQKLMKQMLDSWSVMFTVAPDALLVPDTIKMDVIDSVTKNAMDALNITKTIDPLGVA